MCSAYFCHPFASTKTVVFYGIEIMKNATYVVLATCEVLSLCGKKIKFQCSTDKKMNLLFVIAKKSLRVKLRHR